MRLVNLAHGLQRGWQKFWGIRLLFNLALGFFGSRDAGSRSHSCHVTDLVWVWNLLFGGEYLTKTRPSNSYAREANTLGGFPGFSDLKIRGACHGTRYSWHMYSFPVPCLQCYDLHICLCLTRLRIEFFFPLIPDTHGFFVCVSNFCKTGLLEWRMLMRVE